MSISDNPNSLVSAAFEALQLSPEKVAEFGLINTVEEILCQLDQIENYEVEHYVMPHVIARQAKLPKGAIITTERHRHWHPFIISFGAVSIYNEVTHRVEHIDAVDEVGGHFTSITEPETRRLIFVREDTLWTTFHPCAHGDVERMFRENIFPNNNPLIQPYVR